MSTSLGAADKVHVAAILRWVRRNFGVNFTMVDDAGNSYPDGSVINEIVRVGYAGIVTDGDSINPAGGSNYQANVTDLEQIISDAANQWKTWAGSYAPGVTGSATFNQGQTIDLRGK